MTRHALQPGDPIVVAMKFDNLSTHVLRLAFELAERCKLKVAAIHVVELLPIPRNFLAETITGIDIAQAARSQQKGELEAARERLEKLAREIDPNGLVITTKVLSGLPAQMIAAEAAATNAAFIITGAASVSHRFIPKGLSTALTLMSDASVPVLVMRLETILESSQKEFRVLVADDMRDSGNAALRTALSLACLYPSSNVCHVHVNSLTESALEAALDAGAFSRSSSTKGGARVFDLMVKEIEDQLEKRARDVMSGLSSPGINYNPHVKTGSVAETLDLVIEEFHPDLIVFGRHQTFRSKPLSMGQIPFHSMLSQSVAVMIVPEE